MWFLDTPYLRGPICPAQWLLVSNIIITFWTRVE
jgi:hypothetical protein